MGSLVYGTDQSCMAEIGNRLAGVRLNKGLSQQKLAEMAGVSRRTIERLESGSAGVQLSGLVRILRALDLLAGLDRLLPEPSPGPMSLLKNKGKIRKRAPRSGIADSAAEKWVWGDDP